MKTLQEGDILNGVRLLVALAKADGDVDPDERAVIESALDGVTLPASLTLEAIFEESVDVDQVLDQMSPEGHAATFKLAYSLAMIDGVYTAEEKAILERLRQRVQEPEKTTSLVDRIVAEAKDTVLPSNIAPVNDKEKRSDAIYEDMLKYATLSAALGAFPIPGLAIATDLAIVAIQVKFIRDIGQYHGQTVSSAAARSLLYGLGMGTGARIALGNLAKMVPGWGSIVGATTAFATTWALGRVFDAYFDDGSNHDITTFRKEFETARNEGKHAYDEYRPSIEAKAKRLERDIASLNELVKQGKLSQSDYQKRLLDLDS